MAKPRTLDSDDWAKVVQTFDHESDRGIAVLVGSFVEHALGTFLMDQVPEKAIAEKLFGPMGALSSFSQRIAVAYAFGLVTKEQYLDLEAIRQARNFFAHDPLHATFDSPDVQKHTSRMSHYEPELRLGGGNLQNHRLAYTFTSAALLNKLFGKHRIKVPEARKPRTSRRKSAA